MSSEKENHILKRLVLAGITKHLFRICLCVIHRDIADFPHLVIYRCEHRVDKSLVGSNIQMPVSAKHGDQSQDE